MDQSNALKLYEKGIATYNTWYKLLYHTQITEDALNLFKQAKNQFLMDQYFDNAKECYDWMIKCIDSLGNNCYPYDKIKIYEEYADFLTDKNIDNDNAMVLYNKIIQLCIDDDNFNKIIKIKTKIAEIYIINNDYDAALRNYEEIKKILPQTRTHEFSVICKKIFELSILTNNYDNAFHAHNDFIMKNNETKYKLLFNDIIFECLLVYLLIDSDTIEYKLNQYCSIFQSFNGSFQYKALDVIIIAFSESNISLLSNIENVQLTKIQKHLLLEIEKIIQNQTDDCDSLI